MGERQIPFVDKHLLCEALLQLETFKDPAKRNLYFSELEHQLGQPLSIERFPDATHDALAIVNACLTRDGALALFIQIIRMMHGNSHIVTRLEQIAEKISNLPVHLDNHPAEVVTQFSQPPTHEPRVGPHGHLTPAERTTLVQVMAGTPQTRVADAYANAYQVLPPGTTSDPLPNGLDPSAVIRRLEEGSDPGAVVLVLLRFGEALAHASPPDTALQLHRLTEGLGVRQGFSPTELRQLCAQYQYQRASTPDKSIPGENPADQASGAMQVATTPTADAGDSMHTFTVTAQNLPDVVDLPRIWGGQVPFRNPKFTGREALLLRLRRELTEHTKASVLPQTLHGLGGVGKTQLAVEYAYRYAEHYNLVWWISAERQTDVLASLAELGDRLGVAGQDRQQTARTVVDTLAESPYRWLLVYDNADRPDDIARLVPSKGGHVLLTSRNAEWTTRWHSIEVDVFNRGESIELLRKGDTGIAEDVADRLAEKLGDLPLALEQASTFQATMKISIDEYLELFDERVRELLDDGQPADYPTTLRAFLTLAFDNLRASAPAAAELLEMFAFLGPEPISATLLQKGRLGALSPVLAKSLRDAIKRPRLIRDLRRYGLARVDSAGDKIQVHRLVQMVLRAELDESQLDRARENVRNLLAAASPTHPDDTENWPVHAEMGPHILPADLIHSDNEEARLVAIDQARYLFITGDYRASQELSQAMVDAWSASPDEGGLGRDHEQTLLAMRHLANAFRLLGHYPEARRLGEDAYALLQANPEFGDDHEHTVAVAFGLCLDLHMAGDHLGALTSDERNLERAIRVYGPDHKYTLQAKGNVAVGLRMLGRCQDAHQLSDSVFQDHQEAFGDADTRTLEHAGNLAYDLYSLGRYQETLDFQSHFWELITQVLGEHERDRLNADRYIAIALRKTGRHEAAVARTEHNHQAFTRFFGINHEYTLVAGMSHANALRAAGQVGKAREIAEPTVDRYRTTFGDRHRLTLAAQVNHGIILRQLGERRAAHNLERDTFQALTALLGPEHPYTLSAAGNYATSLLAVYQVETSRSLTAQTLAASRRVRGDMHPDTLACEVNAALDLLDAAEEQSTQQAAQHRLDQVIDKLQQVLGKDHPDTIDAIRGKRADCDIEPPPT